MSWPALTELPINEAPELPARNIPGGKVNRGEFGCLKTHVSTLFRTLIPLWLKRREGRASSKRISSILAVLENVTMTSALPAPKQLVKLFGEQSIDGQKGPLETRQAGGQGCFPSSVRMKQT